MRQECVKKAVPAGFSVLSDSCVPRSGHFPYPPSGDMSDPGRRLNPDGFPTAAFPAAFPSRSMPDPGHRFSPGGFPTAVFPAAFPFRDMPGPGRRLSPAYFPTAVFPAAFPSRGMPGPGHRLSPAYFPTAVCSVPRTAPVTASPRGYQPKGPLRQGPPPLRRA